MKQITLLLIAIGLLASCTKSSNDGPTPIRLTSKITLANRSNQQDIQIVANQQLSFFVTEAGNVENRIYDNAILNANGSGGFIYSDGVDNVLYYPIESINVDFYAIHPYDSPTNIPADKSYEVRPDQTNVVDFFDSDLLYAKVSDLSKTSSTIPLTFNHMLSKLTFTVKQGSGVTLDQLSDLIIINTQINAIMKTATGEIVEGSKVLGNVKAFGVKGTTGGATQVDGIAAIVAPQTVTAGTQMFQLVINGQNFFYTPTANVTFESGKAYNYTLTVNNTGIEVSSSIVDWLPGGNTEGEAS